MIKGRDFVFIASIEWNFLWQHHQEIAKRLAAAGNRVLYVENTGVRSPGLRDAARVASRVSKWSKSLFSHGAREVAPNIFVCSPIVLPPFGRFWSRLLNRHVFLRIVGRAMRHLKMRNVLFWTFLPTDTAIDLIRTNSVGQALVIYYGIADFSHLTPHKEQLQQNERKLLELSDVVFANCSELAYKFSQWNRNVHIFPPGVDISAFVPDAATNSYLRDADIHAKALKPLQRPIIGYIGGLHRFVDYDLVASIARMRPGWSWVFIGARQVDVEKLAELPNLHLLGKLEHQELAAYIREFDVCIVPYLNTPEMSTVVPTKINEYLAVGKPVVSSDLPAVCEFNAAHQILITCAPESLPFLRAIEESLESPGDRRTVGRRRSIAALADWQIQIQRMSAVIEEKLNPAYSIEEIAREPRLGGQSSQPSL